MKTGHLHAIYICSAIFLAIILLSASILAVTANIGNARMILRAKVGDTIEKKVLVININNETIDISSFASGDLKDYITITDGNFSLEPLEERNITFTVKVAKEGTTESKVNVKFFSPTENRGVGLSSDIVVIASKDGSSYVPDENNIKNNNTSEDTNSDTSSERKPFSVLQILFALTGVILLVFLGILIWYYVKSNLKNEESIENHENKTKPKRVRVTK